MPRKTSHKYLKSSIRRKRKLSKLRRNHKLSKKLRRFQKGGNKQFTYTELHSDIMVNKYTTGDGPRGVIPLNKEGGLEKYLFIEKVIEQINLGNPEINYIAPWGSSTISANRTPEGTTLNYGGYPIKKDGIQLVLSPSPDSFPGIDRIGNNVKFMIAPAVQGFGGGTDFVGKGTITGITPTQTTLSIDLDDEYYKKDIFTRGGTLNLRAEITRLLTEKGYSIPINEIVVESTSWNSIDYGGYASVKAGLVNVNEFIYTKVLNKP